jgi:hypothetical protein
MPVITETPILGAAFRKARAAMQGGDAGKRLADAVAKVQQLKARLAAIEAEQKHHAGRFARYVAECREKFERTKAFTDEVALLQAEVVRDWHNEHATTIAQRAQAIYGYGIPQTAEGDAFGKLAEEHPDWRNEVEVVLSLKAEIAEETYEKTLTAVQSQLGGFGAEAVTNDPRVKNARTESVKAQQLVSRFAVEKDLQAWQLAIRALFPA